MTGQEYVLLASLRERARQRELCDAVTAEFETVSSPIFCVRRLDVAEHLAQTLGRVINNRLFADVARAAESLGWVAVKNGNRSLYRGVRRHGDTDEEALTASKANRRDPRCCRQIELASATREATLTRSAR